MPKRTAATMQWAHERSDDEGISVEAVFSQFDRDGSGAIDPLEVRISDLLFLTTRLTLLQRQPPPENV